jgi:hypothetical protein
MVLLKVDWMAYQWDDYLAISMAERKVDLKVL